MLIASAVDIRDIKPPVYFPVNHTLLFIILGLVLLAVILFIVKTISARIKERRLFPKAPPRRPHEIAYELLEELKQKDLPRLGKFKEYYFLLSGIVRRYIEDGFSIRAPEMTTEEFLNSLKNSNFLLPEQRRLLKNFLNLSDIVKFAKYGPTEREAAASFSTVQNFVRETAPEEEEKQGK